MYHYFKLDTPSPFYYHYAYLDTSDYLADQLFIQHEVPVHFGKEYKSQNRGYVMIFCKVKKSDELAFLEALNELPRKMFLLGNKDYEDFAKQNLYDQLPA